jgi:DNA-binding transcriptional LysR family regulator
VAEEPLVLALPAVHPLARVEPLRLADVLAEPLVIFPRRIVPSLHDAIHGLYQAAGRAPAVAQEAIQMQTIVNLVWGGLGVAWVPESVTRFQRAGVVYRGADALVAPGRGRKTAPALPACETSLVWQPQVTNAALTRFIDFVRDLL